MKDIEKARAEFGSVFSAPKREKRDASHGSASGASEQPKRKKPSPPKKKVEIEYNGSLLPFCLETLDNSIVAFFDSLSSYGSLFVFIVDIPLLVSFSWSRRMHCITHRPFRKQRRYCKPYSTRLARWPNSGSLRTWRSQNPFATCAFKVENEE